MPSWWRAVTRYANRTYPDALRTSLTGATNVNKLTVDHSRSFISSGTVDIKGALAELRMSVPNSECFVVRLSLHLFDIKPVKMMLRMSAKLTRWSLYSDLASMLNELTT